MELINVNDQGSIKSYFLKVKELQNSGIPYPVNLDEVWPLCYSQKVKALSVLTKEFADGYDFQLSQMGKVLKLSEIKNGVKIDAYLTVSTMEHFIARKVKEVFEVYRHVFHIATSPQAVLPISQSDDEIILRAVTTLQTRVEDYKLRLLQANNTIIEQAPVVQYANDVLSSPDLISTTVIAKDLGMSANSLNKILRSRGVIYKQAETWVLYSKYQNKEYTHSKTHTHYDSEGKKRTSIHTYWTQKGRQFIHDLLNNQIKSA